KSDAEVRTALEHGVGRIVVDSLVEIDQVAALAEQAGVRAPMMVRVTTGLHAGGHEFIATAHEDQKFGLSLAAPAGEPSPALLALRAAHAHPALELVGIHSHIGSQILDPAAFPVAARRVLELRAAFAAESGLLVPEVDLGGGFGIAYLPGEVALDPARVATDLAAAVVAVARELGGELPRFSVEPGRAVVGPTTATVYTVGTVKPVRLEDGRVRTYVSVDGGMSDNLRTALYGAAYHAEIVSRRSDAEPVPARVVGQRRGSGDVVLDDGMLPGGVRAGDLLAVAATGAYGRSMASNSHLVPRPPVVAVRDGASRVLVRRETIADLLDLDLG